MFLLQVLNIWTTVIITVLISLLVVNICFSSMLDVINWYFSSLWVIFSCFFKCLVIFDWMLDLVNFIFQSMKFFCILINILQFCSPAQLSSLKMILSFWVLLLQFATRGQSSAKSRANNFQLLKQDPYVYFTKCPHDSWCFPLSLVKTGTISVLC